MKIGKKQRIAILERAYDKAAKLFPGEMAVLADMERSVLESCIAWSSRLSHARRTDYRNSVWRHFGWDTPEGKAKWEAISRRIRNG